MYACTHVCVYECVCTHQVGTKPESEHEGDLCSKQSEVRTAGADVSECPHPTRARERQRERNEKRQRQKRAPSNKRTDRRTNFTPSRQVKSILSHSFLFPSCAHSACTHTRFDYAPVHPHFTPPPPPPNPSSTPVSYAHDA